MYLPAGICLLSNIPMRADASERSEMVSQLLFGETFTILDSTEKWLHIRTTMDEYNGWVSTNMVKLLEKEIFSDQGRLHIVSVPFTTCHVSPDDVCLYLPGGSIFSPESLSIIDEKRSYLLDGDVLETNQDVVASAKQYLEAPYLWGGKTVFGIDCSGLVQVVFRMAGKYLPRDAHQQEKLGNPVDFEDIRQGDLAFFANEEHRVIHVGILCDDASIIHASGCVRIDRFDRQGIFNRDEKRYTHQLHSIKRI
ncbi:MAG: C40 family peptidase [Bacteroidales bacterium]|jgi:hypothetical protein|nr:C40 family peptidase [Bacteroidales bacterium]